MELIDQLGAAGEHATTSARESLQEAKLRKELGRAHAQLGGATHALIEERAPSADALTSHGLLRPGKSQEETVSEDDHLRTRAV